MLSNPIKWIFKGFPPRWLFESSAAVRNDLAMQRVARMRALFVTACACWPGSSSPASPERAHLGKLFQDYDALVKKELELRHKVLGTTPFGKGWLEAWKTRGEAREQFHSICRELHHGAHDIQMVLITVLPIKDLEASLPGLREDFESVTDEDSRRGLLESALGAYVRTVAVSNLGSPAEAPVAEDADQPHPPPPATPVPANYEPYLRSFCRQMVTETRRNQLTKRQIEVVRDELFSLVTFSFFFMSAMAGAVFLLFYRLQHDNPWWHEPTYAGAFVASLGGITGASLSAYQRIGTISRSGVTGRNLGELSGAGRPLYQAIGFGCLAAILVQLLIAHAGLRNLGPFTLPQTTAEIATGPPNGTPAATPLVNGEEPPREGEPGEHQPSPARNKQPVSLALLPLLVGLIAGFSERLIPDVIDQYRKK
jgi:hypothetical protein